MKNSLDEFVRSSVELCGAVFVLPKDGSEALNSVLPLVHKIGAVHGARYIGMTSGLLQFIVKDFPEKQIEEETGAFTEAIRRSAGPQAAVAWTVQRCALGCWGGDTTISYGALVPNFRKIIVALASAKPGEVIKISDPLGGEPSGC